MAIIYMQLQVDIHGLSLKDRNAVEALVGGIKTAVKPYLRPDPSEDDLKITVTEYAGDIEGGL